MKLNAITLDHETLSLSVQADIDFELFAQFAEPFAQVIDCRVLERQWGADRHQWLLEFEGSLLQLHYEFYGDICWLSVERKDEFDVLVYLAELMKPYIAVKS